MAETVHSYWVNFAKTGDPGRGDGSRAIWPPFTMANQALMVFGVDRVGVEEQFGKSRFDLIEPSLVAGRLQSGPARGQK